jgi:hypothetical protein
MAKGEVLRQGCSPFIPLDQHRCGYDPTKKGRNRTHACPCPCHNLKGAKDTKRS